MDKQTLRDTIIEASLPHVTFDGWTELTLANGAEDAGLPRGDALRAFPEGVGQAISHYADMADRHVVATLDETDLSTLSISGRVTLGVRLRFEFFGHNRDAVRKALSWMSMPQNAGRAARHTWNAADAIWFGIGDTSVDYNYYTKRMILSGVLGSTALFWLNDESEDFVDTWAFLDRRIADVMTFGKTTGKVKKAVSNIRLPGLPFKPRLRPAFRKT